MAKAKRRSKSRMSGISLVRVEAVCDSHYKGDKTKADVCKVTAKALIKRIVGNKAGLCKSWCGCPK